MAFVNTKKIHKRPKREEETKAVIRHGGSSCLSKKIFENYKTMSFEIDAEEKMIRVKMGKNYPVNVRFDGQFYIGRTVTRIIFGDVEKGIHHIEMKLNKDGWWYGSYDNQNNSAEPNK